MSIVKKIRTWLGLDQQEETMKQLLDAVKNLKEEKKTTQPTSAAQEPQSTDTVPAAPTAASEPDTASKVLIEHLQKEVENLQKQLATAKEDGVKTLFADFKRSQDEKKEKQEKAGRPRIDGKSINLRVDIDTYNMLQFLASRKVLQKTRYINEKLREGLMEDIQSDPVFGSLYNEFTKTEKIQDYE